MIRRLYRLARDVVTRRARDTRASAIEAVMSEASRVSGEMNAAAAAELRERSLVLAYIEHVRDAQDAALQSVCNLLGAQIQKEWHWHPCAECGALLDEHAHRCHCTSGPLAKCTLARCGISDV